MKQSTDKKDKPKKNLYALLIGINKYNEKITGLSGCLNDVAEFSKYLNSKAEYNLIQETLLNENATKANIINAFENHLTKATENDIVFCFFAGHGIQEKTSVPIFQKSEVGDYFESFVCYDSNPFRQGNGKNTCLADKEIRYLINKIAINNPHILLVFDSCHSGGSTRDSGARNADSKTAQKRPWAGFCFHEEFSLEDAEKASSINEILPEGEHVQFSACRDTEVASEYNIKGKPRGVFSYTLLTILNASQKRNTYYSLKNQLMTYMRKWGGAKKQTPQCYGAYGNPHILYSSFLGGEPQVETTPLEMAYNSEDEWEIPLGAIAGIRKKEKIKVWLDRDIDSFFESHLKKIYPSRSLIEVPEGLIDNLDLRMTYDCETKIPILNPISVFVHAPDEQKKESQSGLQRILDQNNSTDFSFIDDEGLANYALHIKEDKLAICHPFDHRPLVAHIEKSMSNYLNILYEHLVHIAKWESLRNSYSPQTTLHDHPTAHYEKYPIELKVFKKKNTNDQEEIPINKGKVSITPTQQLESGKKGESLRFQLINHSDRELHCALFYLSMAFRASSGLLTKNEVILKPGDNVYSRSGNFLDFSLEDHILNDNWEESLDYIKLIISTEAFDPLPMKLDELPLPHTKSRSQRRYNTSNKQNKPKKEDWSCWNLELRLQNPNFKVNQDK